MRRAGATIGIITGGIEIISALLLFYVGVGASILFLISGLLILISSKYSEVRST